MTEWANPNIKLVSVLRSHDAGLILAARSALETAGIDHCVPGAEGLDLNVWHEGWLTAEPTQILVREEDAAAAARLLSPLRDSSPEEFDVP